MAGFSVISADSHVIEPADLWLKYIAPGFRDRAPRVERTLEGVDVFYCDGKAISTPGGMCQAGRSGPVKTMEEIYPGAYDPSARLIDMARDGIDAEVLYPSVGMRLYGLEDIHLKRACFAAYNDWLAEFCNAYPNRFKGLGMIAVDDVEGAIAELQRVRAVGLAGVAITISSDDPSLYSTEHDRFWGAVEELGLPVSLHLATNQKALQFKTIADVVLIAEAPAQHSLANMIFGGLFYRFPRLKVISAENDGGWVGYFVERMDFIYKSKDSGRLVKESAIKGKGLLPSEYFRRNVALTFIRDRTAVEMRHWAGVENVMWSSDYPHDNSTWPRSKDMLDYLFQGVAEEEYRMLVAGNAERLYGFESLNK